LNETENTTHQNLRDAANAEFRGEFIALKMLILEMMKSLKSMTITFPLKDRTLNPK